MKISNTILTVVIVLAVALAAVATTSSNYISEGKVVSLTWSVASPAIGQPAIKCQAKATGGLVGVVLSGTGTAGENVRVVTEGIFDLSVTASSTVGNVAIGDYIFAAVDGINTGTTSLTNINTGLLFGQAMEALTASTSASTIQVKILQPSHL